jgi:hypothetical protein
MMSQKGGRTMKHHLFSAALLAAAVVLETGGFTGVTVMLTGGIAGEILFWTRHRTSA